MFIKLGELVNMYDRLTRKDVEKMQKEVDERKLVVRKQALEDVKEARAQGHKGI